ncbi:thioredoxin family protein [Candidatus Shapirobacteria bacterium]|nr:thioredoxin family protein [Candidatus Shapirobacteria bacterium]
MKNSTTFLVIIVVLTITAFGIYRLMQNSFQSESMMPEEETTMEPTALMMKKDDTVDESDKTVEEMMVESRYIQYSKPTLDNTSNNRRILFFYASWCPTCKPADASFSQNIEKIPQGVTLIRVNYNDPETDQEEKDLAKKYGIVYQHTFVQINSSGEVVTKWNGGQMDELLSNIK